MDRVQECGIGTLARILMSRRDCTTGGISLLANGKGTSTRISTVAWLGFLCFLFSYFILLFGDKIACLRLFELNWTGMESIRRSHRQSPLSAGGDPRAKEKMTDWKLTLANAPPATRSSAFVLHSCALRKRDPDAVSMATGC